MSFTLKVAKLRVPLIKFRHLKGIQVLFFILPLQEASCKLFNYNTDFILYCFMGLGVLAVQDNRPSTSEILALKHEIVSAASDLPSSRFRRKLIDTNEMEFIQVS